MEDELTVTSNDVKILDSHGDVIPQKASDGLDIISNTVIDGKVVQDKEKTNELKSLVSDEEKEAFKQEVEKETTRLFAKYILATPTIAETISVEDVTEDEAKEIIKDVDDLYAFTEIKNGLGLSASQIGIAKKWFVANLDGRWGIYFNPRYFPQDKVRMSFKEGCLTLNNKYDIKRWKNIFCQYWGFDDKGIWKKFNKKFNKTNAVIIQHESDHCAGYPGGTSKPRLIGSI